jgi:hypothetical protein
VTVSRPKRTSYRSRYSVAAFIGIVFLVGAFLSNTQIAHAASVWNVTPTSACTLSDAITANNTSASSGSCTAGSGGIGVINLAAGTYTLNADLTSPSSSLSVVGSGVGSTIINGQNQHAVFTSNGGTLLNVSNLTIEGAGNGEPAILSSGGSINNVVVDNSTTAGFGIVIGGGGSITNTAVTNITENNASNLDGVGITLTGGTFTVTNVTLSGNGVGMVVGSSSQSTTVNATNITIASNSNTASSPGGIAAINTTLNLENSILASNTSSGVAANCGTGPFPLTGDQMVLPTSQGHDISSDNTCGFSGTSNLSSTDPLLGSLTQSSGTYVLPITYSSPAYASAYTAAAPSTDQRGVSRPQCGTADIGAYETTTCAPAPASGSGGGSAPSSTTKKSASPTASSSVSASPTTAAASTSSSSSKTGTTSGKSNGGSTGSSKTADKNKTASTKSTSSHTAIWIGIIVILIAAGGGGWLFLRKNPNLLSKLLSKSKPSRTQKKSSIDRP